MKRYRIRDMTKHVIITMPSCDIYIYLVDNHQEINQCHQIYTRIKETSYSLFVHQTINIDDNINVNHKSQ